MIKGGEAPRRGLGTLHKRHHVRPQHTGRRGDFGAGQLRGNQP